jgi:hypothetical protein
VPSARKRDNHFSEEIWINPALQYKIPIQNLSEKSWELIIDGAWKIAQAKKANRTISTSSNILDASLPVEDERGSLVETDGYVKNDEIDWEASGCESFYCRL